MPPASMTPGSANPKGIPTQSPGLRGTSYPGFIALDPANPSGVAASGCQRGYNPVGVEAQHSRFHKLARSSQPSAEGPHPFLINPNLTPPPSTLTSSLTPPHLS